VQCGAVVCEATKPWCSADQVCTNNYMQSATKGKGGGVCVSASECMTTGAKCTIESPQIYGTCSK
jgi:hypothetical protein